MLGKAVEGVKNHWPLIPLVISAAGIGTAVALGTTKQAMLTLGTSNLPMVLGLSSASLAIIAAMMCSTNLKDKDEKRPLGFLLLSAVTGAVVIGLGYAALHFGIASVLPSTLTMEESLGAQAGIGFGVGSVLAFCILSIAMTKKGNFIARLNINLTVSLVFGISVSASTAVGPALVHVMGDSVADTVQSQALEATISVSIALLSFCLIWKAIDGVEYIQENCGKAKQV